MRSRGARFILRCRQDSQGCCQPPATLCAAVWRRAACVTRRSIAAVAAAHLRHLAWMLVTRRDQLPLVRAVWGTEAMGMERCTRPCKNRELAAFSVLGWLDNLFLWRRGEKMTYQWRFVKTRPNGSHSITNRLSAHWSSPAAARRNVASGCLGRPTATPLAALWPWGRRRRRGQERAGAVGPGSHAHPRPRTARWRAALRLAAGSQQLRPRCLQDPRQRFVPPHARYPPRIHRWDRSCKPATFSRRQWWTANGYCATSAECGLGVAYTKSKPLSLFGTANTEVARAVQNLTHFNFNTSWTIISAKFVNMPARTSALT